MDDDLDTHWFEEQEQLEKQYDKYYKIKVDYVWVSLMYIKDNDIVYIKKEKVFLYDGISRKSNIVNYINKNRILNSVLYKLYTIAMFNMTITPEQILDFDYTDTCYFKPLQHIEEVIYQDTISYLHPVNELFILLRPSKKTTYTTKRKPYKRNQTRRTV